MNEITGLSDLDLKERIAADREALQKLRFNHTIAGLESPIPAAPEAPRHRPHADRVERPEERQEAEEQKS